MVRKIKEYYAEVKSDENGTYLAIPIVSKGTNHEILIDTVDYERFKQYNWSILYSRGKAKYLKRRISLSENRDGQKIELLHRFIKKAGNEVHLDHIDGNGFNCRAYNLRVATSSQNSQNRRRRKDTTSQFKGVCWFKGEKKWVVRICYEKKLRRIARYDKEIINGVDQGEIRAAERYDEEAIRYFGSFALLNFPDERNVVTLKDGKYKMSFLLNEQEKKKIEVEIKVVKEWTKGEIGMYLGRQSVKKLTDLCHYYGCGTGQLVDELKQGILGTEAKSA